MIAVQGFWGCRHQEDYASQCVQLTGKGAYQEALPMCDRAIMLGENSATDYTRRGYIHTQLGQYDEAIADYNQALVLQPDAISIYNHRCVTYYQAGKYREAIADCNQILSVKPTFSGGYTNRGRAKAGLKDKKGAIQDFKKAATLFLKEGNQDGYQIALEELKKVEKK